MSQPFKLYMTGDLVLDEPNADFFFDPARAMLAEADALIGHVEVPHTTGGEEAFGDIPAPGADPENLRAFMTSEIAKWQTVVKTSGAQLD